MKKNIIQHLTVEQQKLVEKNITIAVNTSKRYASIAISKGICVEDIQQEACLGLCEAALRYDQAKGYFEKYAYEWCRKYAINALSNHFCHEESVAEFDAYEYNNEADQDKNDLALKVEEMITTLNVREQQVVKMVYGFEGDCMGFKEIATELKLSKDRIRNIYNKAINKLIADSSL